MSLYHYVCSHKKTAPLTEGIRKCVECRKVIITDKGVLPHE